jgi:hypothetical protein
MRKEATKAKKVKRRVKKRVKKREAAARFVHFYRRSA